MLFIKHLFSVFLIFIVATSFAQNNDYVPLEDRLKSNVFIKVDVSNADCFVDEPIVVTYKLYSALSSESEIITNPDFKNFDVKDIKTEADKIASKQTIDGVVFDVHTVLKLQLKPIKAGNFTLGNLAMRNNIKLIKPNGDKDPVLNNVTESYTLHNGNYDLKIESIPVSIIVTELPAGQTLVVEDTVAQPNSIQKKSPPFFQKEKTKTINIINRLLLVGLLITVALIIILLVKKFKLKKKIAKQNIESKPINLNLEKINIDDLLKPALACINKDGNDFYVNLKSAVINFFECRFNSSSIIFNKASFKNTMSDNNISVTTQTEILDLITELDMNIYSGGAQNTDKFLLLEKAKRILQELKD